MVKTEKNILCIISGLSLVKTISGPSAAATSSMNMEIVKVNQKRLIEILPVSRTF